MSLNSKPLWMEGMFIRPQHLQQQNRYLESLIERRVAGLRPSGWGLRTLSIDRDLLRIGKFGLAGCEAMLPDGTVVTIPQDIEAPPARSVAPETRNRLVKLAVPARRGDGLELAGDEPGGRIGRFRPIEQEIRDSTSLERGSIALKLGALRVQLLLDGEPEDDLITLPLARIEQVDAGGAILLSSSYLPPAFDCAALPRFAELIRELEGLLHNLGEVLAARVAPNRTVNQMAGIVDYLLLTTINRFEPVFSTFSRSRGLHPQDLHLAMIQLAGELATFGLSVRRPAMFPPYLHEDLEASFAPVLAAIRSGLAIVIDESVVSIPLQARDYGIWVAPVADRSLLKSARFVLAAKSSMPAEALRARFPMQVKLGPVEVIRELVNLQIPGIALEPLSVAPRELPYYGGYTYFELVRGGELWERLVNSSAFALHVGSDFTDLALELWALRERAA